MANVKNFSDVGGETVELAGYLQSMDVAEFRARFPTVKGQRRDSFSMWVGSVAGSLELLPLTRAVTYKSNPSRHACDARCIHATGRIMSCECSCGGKNHGSGAVLTCAA